MKKFSIFLLLGAQAIQLKQKDPEEDKAMAAIAAAINAETQEGANTELVTEDTKDAKGSADAS